MNALAVVPLTMSSRDIANLTGKRHDHVMVDIRKMLKELGIHAPDFSGVFTTDRGNTFQCFNLPRREVEILLTGYSVPLRAKVLDRMHELEQQVQQPVFDPGNPDHLRGMLITYTEKVIALEGQVQPNHI